MFVSCFKICGDIFTQCWKACLCCVRRHNYTMVTACLNTHLQLVEFSKTYIYLVERHAKPMLENIYIMFEDCTITEEIMLMFDDTMCTDIFTQSLDAYLQYI